MRKALALAAAVAVVLPFGTAVADEHEEEQTLTWRLVEGWTCNYNDGKGREDLDKVNAEWNAWMDKKGHDDYTAFLMTPQFVGEWNFDVAWIGVARDGHAFGKGADSWMSEGGDVAEKFNDVITCSSHSAYVSTNVKRMPPSDEEGDGRFVLNFSNCSLKNDGDDAFREFRAAHEEWNAYADEHGFDYSAWLWWPMWGETDDSYDFKYVSGAADYTTVGANWQLYADGHWRKSSELLGGHLDCDSDRVYDAEMIRSWADEE
jgi:hypothetical protein